MNKKAAWDFLTGNGQNRRLFFIFVQPQLL